MWRTLSNEAREAIGRLCEQHGRHLYDYCRTGLSASDAELAVAGALLSAHVHGERLRDPEALRPWLYALARCHRAAVAASRPASPGSWTRPGAPGEVADALRALDPPHRELLDLSVRHELASADIAVIFDVSAIEVNTMIAEAADRLEEWVAAVRAARTRDGCARLAVRVTDWARAPGRRNRTRIARHVRSCQACQAAPREGVRAGVLLLGLPLAAIPDTLRDQPAWGDPLPGDPAAWRSDGFPAQARGLMEPPPALISLVPGPTTGTRENSWPVAGAAATGQEPSGGGPPEADEPGSRARRGPSASPGTAEALLRAAHQTGERLVPTGTTGLPTPPAGHDSSSGDTIPYRKRGDFPPMRVPTEKKTAPPHWGTAQEERPAEAPFGEDPFDTGASPDRADSAAPPDEPRDGTDENAEAAEVSGDTDGTRDDGSVPNTGDEKAPPNAPEPPRGERGIDPTALRRGNETPPRWDATEPGTPARSGDGEHGGDTVPRRSLPGLGGKTPPRLSLDGAGDKRHLSSGWLGPKKPHSWSSAGFGDETPPRLGEGGADGWISVPLPRRSDDPPRQHAPMRTLDPGWRSGRTPVTQYGDKLVFANPPVESPAGGHGETWDEFWRERPDEDDPEARISLRWLVRAALIVGVVMLVAGLVWAGIQSRQRQAPATLDPATGQSSAGPGATAGTEQAPADPQATTDQDQVPADPGSTQAPADTSAPADSADTQAPADTGSPADPADTAAPVDAAARGKASPPAPVASISPTSVKLGEKRSGTFKLTCTGDCRVTSFSGTNGIAVSGNAFTVAAPAARPGCLGPPVTESGVVTVHWTGTAKGDGEATEGTTTADGTLTLMVSWTVTHDRGALIPDTNGGGYWSNCPRTRE
ncbi:RNA polymerase sigma factor [Nonomuraea harbinensis]|uniref:Sigma-70 family RNA polymerase sigma factor n=1 Tax=Nonomuraea harbinensis TaxID=1286938 RepID=A0ABW1BMT9_9ACTN|nr:RNA polymerase sigma factor [Nonomuraea harbinensis]